MLRALLLGCFVVLGFSAVSTPAHAQTSRMCQQKQATLSQEIAQLEKAIQILEAQLSQAGVKNLRKRVAEIKSQIDDLRKVVIEKVRQLMSGDSGCRPFPNIPEEPKGGRSILVPERGPPPAIIPPAPPKNAPRAPDEGFAMVPFTTALHTVG